MEINEILIRNYAITKELDDSWNQVAQDASVFNPASDMAKQLANWENSYKRIECENFLSKIQKDEVWTVRIRAMGSPAEIGSLSIKTKDISISTWCKILSMEFPANMVLLRLQNVKYFIGPYEHTINTVYTMYQLRSKEDLDDTIIKDLLLMNIQNAAASCSVPHLVHPSVITNLLNKADEDSMMELEQLMLKLDGIAKLSMPNNLYLQTIVPSDYQIMLYSFTEVVLDELLKKYKVGEQIPPPVCSFLLTNEQYLPTVEAYEGQGLILEHEKKKFIMKEKAGVYFRANAAESFFKRHKLSNELQK